MTATRTAARELPCEDVKNKRRYIRAGIRYFIFVVLTGVFLLGQYRLAGSITEHSSSRQQHQHTTSMKHRRELTQKHSATPQVNEKSVKTPPPKLRFPTTYHVEGILQLPYGEIEEPFEAWYDQNEKMSRIDYYGGMDRTYQREDLGKYGFAAKIVPEFSEKKKKIFRGCLHHVGSKRFPIKAQSIVPAERFFKFDGECKLNVSSHNKKKKNPKKTCYRWRHTFKVLTKINSYTLYTVENDGNYSIPLRYEMMGYDTLLTSYYDKYILQYKNFSPWKYDFAIFEIPAAVHCFDLNRVSEASETTVSSFNPMLEFLSHQQTPDDVDEQNDTGNLNTTMFPRINSNSSKHHFEYIVESIFGDFKNVFSKKYKNKLEHIKRKDIFRHNFRYINAMNRQNLTYKLHLNHFADVTDDEMRLRRGLLNESYHDDTAKPFKPPDLGPAVFPIPRNLDWREYGAVSNVRSQGICGSCYAYAVTGAIEAAHYLKTGEVVRLSEQQIVDCSWGFGNRGCKGGYPYRAMQWIQKHGGVATSGSYGKYLAQEGYCHFNNITNGAIIENYFNVSTGNSSQLKLALALYGPVTVLINTRPRSFKFYDSGIYYDKDCDNKLDHAALAVGYGKENGEEYWLIKNSWSTSWGKKGFIKISMKNDNCGVTQKAVVVHAKIAKRS